MLTDPTPNRGKKGMAPTPFVDKPAIEGRVAPARFINKYALQIMFVI